MLCFADMRPPRTWDASPLCVISTCERAFAWRCDCEDASENFAPLSRNPRKTRSSFASKGLTPAHGDLQGQRATERSKRYVN